jgi:hypothetical protein
MKPNLFNQIKLFFLYRSTIKKNFLTLNSSFNLRKDLSNRLYTVINVPVENFEEPYNIRTADINLIAENYIRDYCIKIGQALDLMGLKELYKIYNLSKVDKYSYLVIIGFSLFQTDKIYRRVINIGLMLIVCFILYKLFHIFF